MRLVSLPCEYSRVSLPDLVVDTACGGKVFSRGVSVKDAVAIGSSRYNS